MEHWFSEEERERLLELGRLGLPDQALIPSVRLFQPDGPGIWIIGELDPSNVEMAYGLADIGVGMPEPGAFSLSEIASLRGRLGLAVERDLSFVPRLSLADLHLLASAAGRIVS